MELVSLRAKVLGGRLKILCMVQWARDSSLNSRGGSANWKTYDKTVGPRWLYLMIEGAAGAFPETISCTRLENFLMGAAKDKTAPCLPKCQPKKTPELAMMISTNSGTFTNSQARIKLTRCSVRLHAVIVKTNLEGFKFKPAQRAARKNTETWVLRTERLRRAEPKSSAQILVTESLG